jgi:hypothetical protein
MDGKLKNGYSIRPVHPDELDIINKLSSQKDWWGSNQAQNFYNRQKNTERKEISFISIFKQKGNYVDLVGWRYYEYDKISKVLYLYAGANKKNSGLRTEEYDYAVTYYSDMKKYIVIFVEDMPSVKRLMKQQIRQLKDGASPSVLEYSRP